MQKKNVLGNLDGFCFAQETGKPASQNRTLSPILAKRQNGYA
jgi:hypothetical protein